MYGRHKIVYRARATKPAPQGPSLLSELRETMARGDELLRNSAATGSGAARSHHHETVRALQVALAPDHAAQPVLREMRARGVALDAGDRMIVEQLARDYAGPAPPPTPNTRRDRGGRSDPQMDTKLIAEAYLRAREPGLDIAPLSEREMWQHAAGIAQMRLSKKGLQVQDPLHAIELDCGLGDDPTTVQGILAEAGVPTPERKRQAAPQRMREAEPETPASLSNPDEDDNLAQCEVCDGSGIVAGQDCARCNGSGYEPSQDRQRISDDGVVGNRHAERPSRTENRATLSDPRLNESERNACRAEWMERLGLDPGLALDGMSEAEARSRFRQAMRDPQTSEGDYDKPEYADTREGAVAALRECGVR